MYIVNFSVFAVVKSLLINTAPYSYHGRPLQLRADSTEFAFNFSIKTTGYSDDRSKILNFNSEMCILIIFSLKNLKLNTLQGYFSFRVVLIPSNTKVLFVCIVRATYYVKGDLRIVCC